MLASPVLAQDTKEICPENIFESWAKGRPCMPAPRDGKPRYELPGPLYKNGDPAKVAEEMWRAQALKKKQQAALSE
jgi:hypothetical protein